MRGGMMASQHASGSIILKLAIVFMAIVLVMVITIPGDIWINEAKSQKECRHNMVSLYEAHAYYYKLKKHYAYDMNDLTLTIQNDSSLMKRQKIVDHTNRLKNAMEGYLNSTLVNNLNKISSNIKNITDDLDQNERYFRSQEQEILDKNIFATGEEMKLKLSSLRGNFENYRLAILALDSLWQLRRDLADFSLQAAARRAGELATSVNNYLPGINFDSINDLWRPLSGELTAFLNVVNSVEILKNKTTIADRVADFQGEIDNGLSAVLAKSRGTEIQETQDKLADINAVYQEFLSDFLVTNNFAQFALTESDSLLMNLNENNFYAPFQRKPYIVSLGDSMNIRIEDPTLLDKLKDMTMTDVDRVKNLPFMQPMLSYAQALDSIKSYYMMVKQNFRRNIDITIKTKELDDVIPRLKEVAVFGAYEDYQNLVDRVPVTDSYSEIKDNIAKSLIATGSFVQVYEGQFFGKLDTLHIEMINQLEDFNRILASVRNNTFDFNWAIDRLNQNLSQIKSVQGSAVLPVLHSIEDDLKNLYVFASGGDERTVYGIFKSSIINHGKVYGKSAIRSWEEEV
jgi:competence protein ComGC